MSVHNVGWPLGRPGRVAAAVVVVLTVLGFRLDAGPSEDGTAGRAADETLRYTGFVVSKKTNLPIAGATVTVRRAVLPDPKTGENRIFEETRHSTNLLGMYSFIIQPAQVAEPRLYIELDVEHPDYASRSGFGYGLSTIRKNEKLGGVPFFRFVQLNPGKAVTGRVETPEGRPAIGVKVLAFSSPGSRKRGDGYDGSFARARTDAEGRFRFVATTPGDVVFWLIPEDYAPSAHALKDDKRGDLGTFTLQEGVRVKGRVLDTQGVPLAGVAVNADHHGSDRRTDVDELLGQLAVGDHIARGAVSGARGEFSLGPLPSGKYRLMPAEYLCNQAREHRKVYHLPAVFSPMKLTIKEGETPAAVEVRAVPHVVIEAQFLDSKGKPRSGWECTVAGRIDGDFWFAQGQPDAAGHILVRAPHGLENASIDFVANEHGALRCRLVKGASETGARSVRLGTLDHDVRGIEVVRYDAPILLVKAATSNGTRPRDVVVTADYNEGDMGPQSWGKFIVKHGVISDVVFEEQIDGRFRSEQLQPDRRLTLKAQADGFKPASRELKLPEGKTEDITLVLEPK